MWHQAQSNVASSSQRDIKLRTTPMGKAWRKARRGIKLRTSTEQHACLMSARNSHDAAKVPSWTRAVEAAAPRQQRCHGTQGTRFAWSAECTEICIGRPPSAERAATRRACVCRRSRRWARGRGGAACASPARTLRAMREMPASVERRREGVDPWRRRRWMPAPMARPRPRPLPPGCGRRRAAS